MAKFGEAPICPLCGKETAKPIYSEPKNIYYGLTMITEYTFLRWENIGHFCTKTNTIIKK